MGNDGDRAHSYRLRISGYAGNQKDGGRLSRLRSDEERAKGEIDLGHNAERI
jgi:hypothetical protein